MSDVEKGRMIANELKCSVKIPSVFVEKCGYGTVHHGVI